MAPINQRQEDLSDPELPKFKEQNYDHIKKDCISAGELWKDPEFGPNDVSLGKGHPLTDAIEWRRVHDISKEARLFIRGHSVDDVKQGCVGDCWFAASVACLAQRDPLVKRVLPRHEEQELNTEDYCGVLLFKLYWFGEWTEVVLDDYLPTRNGELVFMSGRDRNEFWAAFLEKAYAKMRGCYQALEGGQTATALSCLTGGNSQTIEFEGMRNSPGDCLKLYKKLQRALSRGALVCLGISRVTGEAVEDKRDNGLVAGHAYSVLRCFELPEEFSEVESKRELVKVRNPWGEAEWNGKWGDNSQVWLTIPQKEKDSLQFTNQDDGEFWMEFDDLVAHFSDMTICHMTVPY